MSNLATLSDAELDVVCGGNGGTTVNVGNGGNGGTAVNGVNKTFLSFNLVGVNQSAAFANGGKGGFFFVGW